MTVLLRRQCAILRLTWPDMLRKVKYLEEKSFSFQIIHLSFLGILRENF